MASEPVDNCKTTRPTTRPEQVPKNTPLGARRFDPSSEELLQSRGACVNRENVLENDAPGPRRGARRSDTSCDAPPPLKGGARRETEPAASFGTSQIAAEAVAR